MTVYTDGVHLSADSLAELHAFAQSIGLKREWFQDHPRHPHYDTISLRLSRLAVRVGASRVSSRDVLAASKRLAALEAGHG